MPKHTLTLPSCTKSICQLEQFIGVVAQKYKIGNDKFPDILISLTEAVNNAIIHGNKEDRAKQVKIDLDKTALGFSFTVVPIVVQHQVNLLVDTDITTRI